MTGPTEGTGVDHPGDDAIRSLMQEIREMPVEDRAILARGLVCDLAATIDRELMSGLLDELWQEAERVQDVRPSQLRDSPAAGTGERGQIHEGDAAPDPAWTDPGGRTDAGGQSRYDDRIDDLRGVSGVGHYGRGEFRSGRLL
jgi:hypothetical protein